jgi:hypothetical protein
MAARLNHLQMRGQGTVRDINQEDIGQGRITYAKIMEEKKVRLRKPAQKQQSRCKSGQ